jgi:hypothetical protein
MSSIPGGIIPLIGQLLTLGYKLADIIEKSNEIDEHDKVAMRVAITTARDDVKHWDDKKTEESN